MPGIILHNHGTLDILLANLTKKPITIKRKQKVAFLHLVHNSDIFNIEEMGQLSEFNLPGPPEESSQTPNIFSIIPRDQLDDLDEYQKDEFEELIERFDTVVSKGPKDVGCAHGITHTIDTGPHAPICARPIRRSRTAEQEVNEEVHKLLEQGLLVKSKSPWSSPLLIVKKKDGSNQVVMDYCCLNSISKKDVYPLPQIDDALDKLGKAIFFLLWISSLDTGKYLWMLLIKKNALLLRLKAYINQLECLKDYATRQQPSNVLWILSCPIIKKSCVLVYLDNINVFSRSFEEHMRDLEQVFISLRGANLKIKPEKCHFFKKETGILRLSQKSRWPATSKKQN